MGDHSCAVVKGINAGFDHVGWQEAQLREGQLLIPAFRLSAAEPPKCGDRQHALRIAGTIPLARVIYLQYPTPGVGQSSSKVAPFFSITTFVPNRSSADRRFWSVPGGRGRAAHERIRQHAHIGQGSLVATRPILPVGAQIAAAPPRGNCQALSALRSIHGRARPDRCGDSSALLHQHFSDHHARSRRYTSGGREEGIFRTARNLNVHTPGQASAAIVHKLIKIKVGVDSRGQS